MKYANGHTRVNHAYSARDYSNGTRIHVRPRRELTREPSGGEWIVYLENKLVSAQKKNVYKRSMSQHPTDNV